MPICHNGCFSFSRLLFPVSGLAAQCCCWVELCSAGSCSCRSGTHCPCGWDLVQFTELQHRLSAPFQQHQGRDFQAATFAKTLWSYVGKKIFYKKPRQKNIRIFLNIEGCNLFSTIPAPSENRDKSRYLPCVRSSC